VNETNLFRKKLHQKEKDRLYHDHDQYGSDVMSLVAREELEMDFRAQSRKCGIATLDCQIV
jgi:hypothetical protein